MSKKQWLVLLMIFLLYLLLGATIYYHIESQLEVESVKRDRISRIEINDLIHKYYMPEGTHTRKEILQKLTTYCRKSVFNYTENEADLYKWDFFNSFYFAYTVVSTIGYGNLAPTTMLGRILMIFYALIGIPMNGILLSQLGEYFGNVFIRAHKKYKSYKSGHESPGKGLAQLETHKAGLAAQIFIYLTPGFVLFIFFPAFLFSYWEGWQYDESVYYAFVTLSTIGFGDYVAGQDNTKGSGIFWIAYKIFLICWISFGLGYLVMIMNFISRGMRSKRITRIEHKLAMNLKQTQNKILNEFNKDVNYLRRVFNEIYLMKLKPVYRYDYDSDVPMYKFPRSHSFPDLRELIYGGRELEVPIPQRKRANSEVAPMTQCEAINRAVSENDLSMIDKKATFASHAMVQPAELLARLVNVLGYIPPSDDFEPSEDENIQSSMKGVDGFSDMEILAGEKSWAGSGWRIGDIMSAGRKRAASEIRLEKDDNGFGHHNSEWTWSGPAASRKIQELMKARQKSGASTPWKDGKSGIPTFSLSSVPKTIRPRWFNPFSSRKNTAGENMSRRESLHADDIETNLRENYASHTTNSRPIKEVDRRKSATPHYFTHTGGNLPKEPDSNLLEETSLADFLRALTSLHSRVGAVPEDYLGKPQRKMGTASLTPPKIPSLLALFSPPPGFNPQSTQSTITAGQMAGRRFSLRPEENSGASTPSYPRRGSLMSGIGLNRFSIRPEDNSSTVTSAYTQRRGSLVPGTRPRRFSLKPAFTYGGTFPNTPPYTPDLLPLHIRERQNPPPYSADPFMFECPKEPLVRAEVGPAHDGISPPGHTAPVPRRFSLRPAQIGVPPAPASPKISPMGRPIPRWKGGMLHRQISELNLQRRARAFSLGDVNSVRSDRHVGPTSPLALPNATSNFHSVFPNRPTQTTERIDSQKLTTVPSGILSQKKIDGKSHEEARIGASQPTNPFSFDMPVGKSEESAASDTSGLYRATPASTVIKIEDHKAGVEPFANDQNLYSVLVDKPSSRPTQFHPMSKELDSLDDVKVDMVSETKISEHENTSLGLDVSDGRKVSMMSQQSTGSSDGEKSRSRKISAMSQQSIELGSVSASRKSSKSRSDKPRVSIESYKTLTELKIEKPATNPFEQYKANVEKKSPGSRKTSTEAKADAVVARHRHSRHEPAETFQLESYKQISGGLKDPEA